jgi:hypothetical protein
MCSISVSSNDYYLPIQICCAVEEKNDKIMATDERTTKHTRRLSRDNYCIIVDNLSKGRRSGDDFLPCLPRRTPEESPTTPTTTKQRVRTTRDISKLSKSPQLSRLRRQKVIFGEEPK